MQPLHDCEAGLIHDLLADLKYAFIYIHMHTICQNDYNASDTFSRQV